MRRAGNATLAPALALALALALGAAGCTFDASPLEALQECSSEVDCDPPLVCHAGYCLPVPDGDRQDAGPRDTGEKPDVGGDEDADSGGSPDVGAPPDAALQVPSTGVLGDKITLDGRQSTGTGLTWRWMAQGPDGAEIEVEDGGDGTARLLLRTGGLYRVSLTVVDHIGRSARSDTVNIEVRGFTQIGRLSATNDLATVDGSVVWVAADDGALRFEPESRSWLRYESGDPPRTTKVVLDPWFAWFAREGAGAIRVKREHEPDDRRPAVQQSLPGIGTVVALARSRSNAVWFGGSEGLKRTTASEFGSLSPRLEIDGEQAIRALLGTDMGMWVGRTSGVCQVPPSDGTTLTCEVSDVVPDSPGQPVLDLITTLALDGFGTLWVGTEVQGLYRRTDDGFDGIPPGTAEGLPQGSITDLHTDPGGDVWGVSTGGLFRVYVTQDGGFEIVAFTGETGLEGLGTLRGMHITSSGPRQIWIAAEKGIAFL